MSHQFKRVESSLSGNSVLQMNNFYISYLPPGNMAGFSFFDADDSGAETALVKDGKFYILNGDHREAYEKLVDEGFDACFKYYEEHKDQRSSWSN